MKKLLLSILVLFAADSFAQQDPQFTQNMFNKLAVNPGFAGVSNAYCATLISRQQWLGFEGRPQTNLFSLDAKIRPFDRFNSGVGLTVWQDELGFEKTLNAKLAYAYHKNIGNGLLSIGIEGGIYNKSVNGNWITSGPNGLGNGSEDPSIPDSEVSDLTFDLGFGAYYATQDFYVGLSTTHLTAPQLSAAADRSSLDYSLARHFYVMGGYNISFAGPFELKPSIFIKSDVSSTQVDLNVNLEYNQLLWGGLSYRYEDAIAILAGVNVPMLEGLKVGVSYDYNISLLNDYSSGSLEFMVGYCYPISNPLKVQRYKSVRFL